MEQQINVKTCKICKIEKNISEMTKGRKECKICWAAVYREYYKKNTQKESLRKKTYRHSPHGLKVEALIHARRRAKKKNLPFDLTIEDIPDVPEMCPVLPYIKLQICDNIIGDTSPTLDRKNPSLGYVKGNVQFISNRANKLKSDGTIDEFLLVIEHLKNL